MNESIQRHALHPFTKTFFIVRGGTADDWLHFNILSSRLIFIRIKKNLCLWYSVVASRGLLVCALIIFHFVSNFAFFSLNNKIRVDSAWRQADGLNSVSYLFLSSVFQCFKKRKNKKIWDEIRSTGHCDSFFYSSQEISTQSRFNVPVRNCSNCYCYIAIVYQHYYY